jgi:AcrR family transcriptional regulator
MQMDPVEDADSRASILRQAMSLGALHGTDALTARKISKAAGLSTSTVNYQFGGVDGLMAALFSALAQSAAEWRKRKVGLGKPEESPVQFVVDRLQELTGPLGAQTLLLAEMMVAGSHPDHDLHAVTVQETYANVTFWRSALKPWGDTALTRLLAIAATAAFGIIVSDPEFWMAENRYRATLERLADRLDNRPLAPNEAFEVVAFPQYAGKIPRGKKLILEAAIRLIGERGVGHLTHRNVAAEAGLSLAATTFFFKDKPEIIFEAFRYLHSEKIIPPGFPPGDVSAAEMLLDPDGEPRWTSNIYRAFCLYAARNPSLANILRSRWGSVPLLRLKGHGVDKADALDGYLDIFLLGGLQEITKTVAKANRRSFLDSEEQNQFDWLYRERAIRRAPSCKLSKR